jgi:hypothetical protein
LATRHRLCPSAHRPPPFDKQRPYREELLVEGLKGRLDWLKAAQDWIRAHLAGKRLEALTGLPEGKGMAVVLDGKTARPSGSQFEPQRVRKPDRAPRPVPRRLGAAMRSERSKRTSFCSAKTGGQRGIRTLDRLSPIHAFQACAFNHSATCPSAYRLACLIKACRPIRAVGYSQTWQACKAAVQVECEKSPGALRLSDGGMFKGRPTGSGQGLLRL